jgi:hypothetical protein
MRFYSGGVRQRSGEVEHRLFDSGPICVGRPDQVVIGIYLQVAR